MPEEPCVKMRRITGKSRDPAMVVTQSAASVVGRITGEATAGDIFCNRVSTEVHEYLVQLRNAVAHEKSCSAKDGLRCRLCPFKTFTQHKYTPRNR